MPFLVLSVELQQLLIMHTHTHQVLQRALVTCITADNRAVNTCTKKASHFCCLRCHIVKSLNYSCISCSHNFHAEFGAKSVDLYTNKYGSFHAPHFIHIIHQLVQLIVKKLNILKGNLLSFSNKGFALTLAPNCIKPCTKLIVV